MSAVLTVLSVAGPIFAGSLLVKRISGDMPAGLRVALGAALGTGLAGTIYFLALLLSDSPRVALAASECVLASATAILLFRPTRTLQNRTKLQSSNNFYAFTFAVVASLAGAAFVLALDFAKHTGGDALLIWNLRARLIATSQTSPLSAILDPVFLGLHADYPLLLPVLVSRGWQYAGSDTLAIPVALASLFTITTIGITVAGLRQISTNSQSWIAGCILAGTPFLLRHGASQYADIEISCFMTAAVVLYAIHDRVPAYRRLPLLAGMAAAAAACTKNEGILFLAVILASRIAVAVQRKSWAASWREIAEFAGGASFGLLTLVIFKLAYSPPNDLVPAVTAQQLVVGLTNSNFHFEILRGFRKNLNFGQWQLNPIPIMAVHAAVGWKPAPGSTKVPAWFTAGFVLIGMLVGYYLLYLVSPYGAVWHLQGSLDRLLLQLWPIGVVTYSVMVASGSPAGSSASSRVGTLRVAAVAAVIAATVAIMAWPAEDKETWIPAGTKPHIELSRSEITAGQTYTIKIAGVAKSQVDISYSIDGKPMGQFGAYIGTEGKAEFQVSPTTPKGMYRFLAVRRRDDPVWVGFENDVAISVK